MILYSWVVVLKERHRVRGPVVQHDTACHHQTRLQPVWEKKMVPYSWMGVLKVRHRVRGPVVRRAITVIGILECCEQSANQDRGSCNSMPECGPHACGCVVSIVGCVGCAVSIIKCVGCPAAHHWRLLTSPWLHSAGTCIPVIHLRRCRLHQ